MKNNSSNLVLQIADDLRKKIGRGELPVSGRIFSARQLAVLYNCSHQTANSALNLLANEGAITRKQGSGSYRKQEIVRPKIACLMKDSHTSDFSTLSYFVKFLLLLLEKNQCDYQLFSFQDLQSANFSPHLFREFDGLITDTRYSDHNSMQLIYDFDRPKLWPWPTFYQLATGNQVVADYISTFIQILKKAKLWGIKKCYLYHRRNEFLEIMQAAVAGSSWDEAAIEYINLGPLNSIMSACKYAMDIPAEPDILHMTSADMIAWGFYEAMMERGLEPGDFHITGLGNMEGFGFIPLGAPKLTTTYHPREPYLEMAVQMFCRQIREKSNVSEIIRIPGELILRESAFYKKK
ncbi:MAG: GntR family transcriptional regulator [Lentisphaerae bacterium]|nr:GntR family transcriptional regulator [Lentisphaerota bacterium]